MSKTAVELYSDELMNILGDKCNEFTTEQTLANHYALKKAKEIELEQSSYKDARIKELEARLETAEKVIKRTDTWLKGWGKDFQEDIEYAIKKFLTNKTE